MIPFKQFIEGTKKDWTNKTTDEFTAQDIEDMVQSQSPNCSTVLPNTTIPQSVFDDTVKALQVPPAQRPKAPRIKRSKLVTPQDIETAFNEIVFGLPKEEQLVVPVPSKDSRALMDKYTKKK